MDTHEDKIPRKWNFVEDNEYKMLGELDEAMLQEGEKNDKPSYSEIVQKNLQ